MNPSLKYAVAILIILLLVWWFLKSREHFEQCDGKEKNRNYQYQENKDRSCKNNCECRDTRVCNGGMCVTA